MLYFFFFLLFLPLRSLGVRLLDTSVSCDQNNFILLLNFDSLFRGLVYSEEEFPNCVYVNATMLPQKQYQLKIPLNGCETKTNSEGNFENAIIVQENGKFLQSSDKKFLLTCIPSAPTIGAQRESLITVDFGGVTVDSSHTTTEVVSNTLPAGAAAPALKYTVEIRSGHEVDSPVLSNALNIGDPISYVVRLQKPVADAAIGRCWASDAASNLELSDERGCSVQPKGNVWGLFERMETQNEVMFSNRIRAWAFPTSAEVNIFCNLRVCMSRVCSFTNCSSEPAVRQRRQNSVGDLAEVETLSTTLRFRRDATPIASAEILTDEGTEAEPRRRLVCLSSSHLALLAACLFAVLVLVALIVWVTKPSAIVGKRKR